MNVEDIAKICHEANKAYCDTLGDTTQVGWNEAPDWQQESAINGVNHLKENPDSVAEDSHNSWLKEKEEAGWVFGAEKDVDKKTHPCFVPYGDLPSDQKVKDLLFMGIANTLLYDKV